MNKNKWIVIFGKLVDGFVFYGTFDSYADANIWGGENCESGFSIAQLHSHSISKA
jgi:hypothetical protein